MKILSFIVRTKNPCKNCINYVKYKYPHDEIYDPETKIGYCSLFGKENLVSGEINYENALSCRINDVKCGEYGRYFQQKP